MVTVIRGLALRQAGVLWAALAARRAVWCRSCSVVNHSTADRSIGGPTGNAT